jgi:hypothetical protein
MDWIYLAQGIDQWRAFVNTVMNVWKFLSSRTTVEVLLSTNRNL